MEDKFSFEVEHEDVISTAEKLKAKYRLVFLQTDMGIEVLGDILKRLRFGCFLNEAMGDIALNNAALEILGMLKILEPGNENAIIKALANVIPKI